MKKLKHWFQSLTDLPAWANAALVSVWIASVAWALYAALSDRYIDTSGWWQVFIDLIGTPLILLGLLNLRKNQWKPEIAIGVVEGWPRHSDIRNLDRLSTRIRIDQEFPAFSLVVRNNGKRVARSVKVRFELLGEGSLIIVRGDEDYISSEEPNREYPDPTTGTRELDIYAKDDEVFRWMDFHSPRTHSPPAMSSYNVESMQMD